MWWYEFGFGEIRTCEKSVARESGFGKTRTGEKNIGLLMQLNQWIAFNHWFIDFVSCLSSSFHIQKPDFNFNFPLLFAEYLLCLNNWTRVYAMRHINAKTNLAQLIRTYKRIRAQLNLSTINIWYISNYANL